MPTPRTSPTSPRASRSPSRNPTPSPRPPRPSPSKACGQGCLAPQPSSPSPPSFGSEAMRALPVLVVAAALLSLATVATAQDEEGEPGCVQGNPCEVILEVDANGIADLEPDTFGTGDWILFSIYNADDEDHTLHLEGHTFEADVPAGDIEDTQPFELGAPGTYTLTDLPTGDEAEITVEAFEVFSGSGTSTKSDSPIPGLAPALLVLGLALAALVVRRE